LIAVLDNQSGAALGTPGKSISISSRFPSFRLTLPEEQASNTRLFRLEHR
jgi:hypothetical protein